MLRSLIQRSRSSRSGNTTGNTTGNVTGNTTGVSQETKITLEDEVPQDPRNPRNTAAYEDSHHIGKEILEVVAQYNEACRINNTTPGHPSVGTSVEDAPENDAADNKKDFVKDECKSIKKPREIELKDLVISNDMALEEAGIFDREFVDDEGEDDDEEEVEEVEEEE